MTEKVKERRPTVAALLSLVLVGLGQLYNGQPQRALVIFGLFILGFIAEISTVFHSYHNFVIYSFGFLILVGVRIFAVIDAIIGARRIGKLELRRYNRWYVYVSIWLVATITFDVTNPSARYSIFSGAMKPTLLVGDYLVAKKYAYQSRDPERGDVAVFKLPRDNETDYIMRIVGLPGDKIQVKGGVLYIDGRAVDRRQIQDYVTRDYIGRTEQLTQYREILPNGRPHLIIERTDQEGLDNTPVYTVPAKHYFAMGDNRDNSLDSRVLAHVGFIPAENLVGRAEFLYFSQNGSASWWQISRWPQAIRFGRIGNRID